MTRLHAGTYMRSFGRRSARNL
ncbi:protein of unknown function [Methylacidimicrobium sp. AP8]|nr:protein of unknown function [Methylacidimicrobium sp. AP8]